MMLSAVKPPSVRKKRYFIVYLSPSNEARDELCTPWGGNWVLVPHHLRSISPVPRASLPKHRDLNLGLTPS